MPWCTVIVRLLFAAVIVTRAVDVIDIVVAAIIVAAIVIAIIALYHE